MWHSSVDRLVDRRCWGRGALGSLSCLHSERDQQMPYWRMCICEYVWVLASVGVESYAPVLNGRRRNYLVGEKSLPMVSRGAGTNRC